MPLKNWFSHVIDLIINIIDSRTNADINAFKFDAYCNLLSKWVVRQCVYRFDWRRFETIHYSSVEGLELLTLKLFTWDNEVELINQFVALAVYFNNNVSPHWLRVSANWIIAAILQITFKIATSVNVEKCIRQIIYHHCLNKLEK